jgi:hypothetical protein
MLFSTGRNLAAFGIFVLGAHAAGASEVKVFSTIGVQAALEELAPKFEQASGHKLAIAWATAAVLVKRVQGGETADLLILTRQSLDALIKDGKASTGPDAEFASSGIAVVVKKGAARPDISTAEAFKRTLLAAPAIAYSQPGIRRRQRRLSGQAAGANRHRRSAQGQNEIPAAERQRRQPRRQWRGRTRHPAGAGSDLGGRRRSGRPAARRPQQHHGLCGRPRHRHQGSGCGPCADQIPAHAGSHRGLQGERTETGVGVNATAIDGGAFYRPCVAQPALGKSKEPGPPTGAASRAAICRPAA